MARFNIERHTNSDTTESWHGSFDLFCQVSKIVFSAQNGNLGNLCHLL